jgi:uncharacterized protein YbaR (Trm112 family)
MERKGKKCTLKKFKKKIEDIQKTVICSRSRTFFRLVFNIPNILADWAE